MSHREDLERAVIEAALAWRRAVTPADVKRAAARLTACCAKLEAHRTLQATPTRKEREAAAKKQG